MVVLVGGVVEDSTPAMDPNVVRALKGLLGGGMSTSESVRLLTKISGASRRELYRVATQSEIVGKP